MQEVLSVPNEVAAELAGVGDGVLNTLRDRLRCTLRLRGNQLTIEGDDEKVAAARAIWSRSVRRAARSSGRVGTSGPTGLSTTSGTAAASLAPIDPPGGILASAAGAAQRPRLSTSAASQSASSEAIRGTPLTCRAQRIIQAQVSVTPASSATSLMITATGRESSATTI